jgi:hypothetical protein
VSNEDCYNLTLVLSLPNGACQTKETQAQTKKRQDRERREEEKAKRKRAEEEAQFLVLQESHASEEFNRDGVVADNAKKSKSISVVAKVKRSKAVPPAKKKQKKPAAVKRARVS